MQKALGIASNVGFHAPLRLLPGDVVEVSTRSQQPLPGSPQRVGANVWLPASANHHAAFAPLKDLLNQFGASHFKPFFKRNTELSAVALRGELYPDILVKLAASPAHIADIQAFYNQVLVPNGLPVPELLAEFDMPLSPGRLVYRYVEGKPYSAAALLTDHSREQVMALLERLHAIPAGKLKRANPQQPYWVYLQRLVMRQALVTLDVAHIKKMVLMWRCINRLPSVLSHGDLHAGNVLVNEKTGQLVIIDWDRWGALPIGYDEACFLRGLPFHQALEHLPINPDLRIGFAVTSYWLGLVQDPKFRFTSKANEM
ncbi:MAG: aminoglycoside phosphotransferase family protein, partial [Halomonas sp.]|nr:aminoglycoside phosphotransferase family protein [Halomonas sp.]